ncbi:NCS2 family permease [bacterium]|nr:NCS2 family permease [bacterium]
MYALMDRIFNLEQNNANTKTEIMAGVTTFLTMAYIIIVNPAILEAAGIPKGPSMVATIIATAFGTLMMGLYANRPFAIAPYMGENAFIAFTVVKVLGYTWEAALGAVFLGGALFTILTLSGLKAWMAKAIPSSLKYSFAAGIGLFLTLIGLIKMGIVSAGVPDAPLHVGMINSKPVLIAVFGFIITAALLTKKVKGSILIGILATSAIAFIMKAAPLPHKIVSLPPSIRPLLFKIDLKSALSWKFFAVILVVFVMDFVDTIATLIGVSARSGMLDKNGNLPDIQRAMLCDALATVVGALAGTTTTGTYIESAAGVEAGGRTGLTAVTVAILFLLSLFFAPLFTAIPAAAYAPVLVIVGLLMLEAITKIDFKDYTETVPAFAVLVLMSFTFNIGIGMTAGFVLYPLFKIIDSRAREVHLGMWIFAVLSLLFFVFYPY